MAAVAATPGATASPMVYLRPENPIVYEDLRKRLEPSETEPVDIRLTDFDDVKWRIEVPEDTPNLVLVSIVFPSFAQLKAIGVEEHLRKLYGPLLTAPYEGSDVTLTVEKDNMGGATPADVAQRVSALRRHVASWPYLRMMQLVAGGSGATTPPLVLTTRPREPVYLLPRPDRLTVIFQLEFEEATDRAMGRLLAQELQEARGIGNAPPASWSEREPPLELKGFAGLRPLGPDSIGYITFSLFPANHFKSEGQREACAVHLSTFRSYVGYHMVAAKSALHARMRGTVDRMQQVLNRAIPEDPLAPVEKKLASGKAFVRKP